MKKFVCSQEKLTNRILLQLLLYFAFSVLCSHSTDEHDVSAINTNEKNGENCGVQDDRIGMIFKQNKKDFSLYSYRSPSFPDTSNGHITSSFGSNEIKNVIDFRKDSLKSQNNQYPFLHTSLNEILSKIMQKSLGKNSETSPHSSDLSIDRSSSNRVAIETRSKKCLKRIHNKNSRPKSDISFSNKYDFFFDDDDYSVNHKNEVLRHFNIRPDKCDTIGKTDNDASRVVIDDDVCILLDVYQNTGDLSNSECGLQQSTKYELLEPVELELGMTDRHAVDFAYMPVMSSDVYPTSYFSDDDMNPDDNITIETDNSTTQDYEDTSLVEEVSPNVDQWWQWWIPSRWWKNKIKKDSFSSNYRLNNDAFAGGSHGEVWRGRRKCNIYEQQKQSDSCNEQLIFKRLRVEAGYHTLEAGLREVYFGSLLQGTSIATTIGARSLFTNYVEHFFGQGGELWIVFKDAGPSLRSYMYTAKKADDFVIFQHSWFWTLLRMSVAKKHRVKSNKTGSEVVAVLNASVNSTSTNSKSHQQEKEQMDIASVVGRELMRSVLRQILESASFLHENDIIHRYVVQRVHIS